MSIDVDALRERLRAFDLDDPASPLNFTRRLARENRWNREYARRVVEEYKRFALLAMAAGHPVTPSDAVDQAWHLHLVYTRSYWDEFCGRVLGRPLHHGPTRGGAAEAAKYHDWYDRTLESYRRIFGAEPPTDIWPPAAVRFGRDLHFARVNTRTHWVVPRPAWLARRLVERARMSFAGARRPGPVPRRAAVVGLLLLAAGIAVGGCVAPGAAGLWAELPDLAGLSGAAFLGLFIPLAAVAVLGSIGLRIALQRWSGSGTGLDDRPAVDAAKIDPYEVALLVRGPGRVVLAQVALTRLLGAGAIRLRRGLLRRPLIELGPEPAAGPPHPVEEAVREQVRRKAKLVAAVVGAVSRSDAARQVEARLRKRDVVFEPAESRAIRAWPALMVGLVLALGIWRVVLGITRGRPVGFLVAVCVVLAMATAGHLLILPWRTRRGDALRDELHRHHPPLHGEMADPLGLAYACALFGAAGLPREGDFELLRTAIDPPTSGGGSGGAGDGGCGGGGCGGGGCGGCGGGGG